MFKALAMLAIKIGAASLCLVAAPANANDDGAAPFLLAPSTTTRSPALKQALLYRLKLHLAASGAFADQLVQLGVDSDDIEKAMDLAADRLGDGKDGCDVTLEVSRSSNGQGLLLERAVVLARSGSTVLERRRGALAVASRSTTRTSVPLV